MRWFVHVDQSYYPSAHVVDAESPREAIEKAWKASGSGPGYPIGPDEVSFVVAALDRVGFAGDAERVAWMFDEEEAPVAVGPIPPGLPGIGERQPLTGFFGTPTFSSHLLGTLKMYKPPKPAEDS